MYSVSHGDAPQRLPWLDDVHHRAIRIRGSGDHRLHHLRDHGGFGAGYTCGCAVASSPRPVSRVNDIDGARTAIRYARTNVGVIGVGHGDHVGGIRPDCRDPIEGASPGACPVFGGENRPAAAITRGRYPAGYVSDVVAQVIICHILRGPLSSAIQNGIFDQRRQPVGGADAVDQRNEIAR